MPEAVVSGGASGGAGGGASGRYDSADKGFMIACDDCEVWFHGPCVGFSGPLSSAFDSPFGDDCTHLWESVRFSCRLNETERTVLTKGGIRVQ